MNNSADSDWGADSGTSPPRGGSSATRAAPTAMALIKHMTKFYSDWSMAHDLDCVEMACQRNPRRLRVVRRYARARRAAPDWQPHRPRQNNHDRIPEGVLRDILEDASFVDRTDSRTCHSCGEHLGQRKRRDARFCSTRCRVAAARKRALAVTDTAA